MVYEKKTTNDVNFPLRNRLPKSIALFQPARNALAIVQLSYTVTRPHNQNEKPLRGASNSSQPILIWTESPGTGSPRRQYPEEIIHRAHH
ncbi:hypothetical protein TNCV_3935971 [Trichonephila clavipes]|nr:hypothetical protein TNCV_3935971 [Trichonephila clavipes]